MNLDFTQMIAINLDEVQMNTTSDTIKIFGFLFRVQMLDTENTWY